KRDKLPIASHVGKHLKAGGVVDEVIEELRLEYHVAAVDPTVTRRWLFVEGEDAVVMCIEVNLAEARGWADRREGRDLAMAPVELEDALKADIGYAAPVRQQECLPAKLLAQTEQTTAGIGRLPRINEMHAPILGRGTMGPHRSIDELDLKVCIERMVV